MNLDDTISPVSVPLYYIDKEIKEIDDTLPVHYVFNMEVGQFTQRLIATMKSVIKNGTV